MPRPLRRPALPAAAPRIEAAQAGLSPRITLELRTLTPVVGGGTATYEPDELEAVRVPGIRGQLREWWRRLYGKPGDDADALFAREADLWGGVGVESESRGRKAPGLQSRVRLWISNAAPGLIKPAGEHRIDSRGLPKAAAEWTSVSQGLGYALFPLQIDKDERRAYEGTAPLPTKRVRTCLSFRLEVSVRDRGGEPAGDGHLRETLASLWAWVHLGGVGGRTRRGFGALELAEACELRGFPSALADAWEKLFAPPVEEGFGAVLGRFATLAHARYGWLSQVSCGPRFESPEGAHDAIVAALRDFRQKPGFARDPKPSSQRPPGRSRWPEPNMLRLHRAPQATWEHPVDPSLRVELPRLGAPRAAFGLPIVAHFKPDGHRPGEKPDVAADAQLLPENHERWASPLLLRPVRWRGDEFRPLVVVLPVRVPPRVRIRWDREPKGEINGVPVKSSTGSRGAIKALLEAAGGDALSAFVGWLRDAAGYQSVPVEQQAREPEA